MYFATNEKRKMIQNEYGDYFTIKQFKTILKNAALKNNPIDMTLMTQRLISLDFDFDKLNEFYKLYP